MDNAVIVYESMFGGTRRVTEAVAAGLVRSTRCTVVEVGQSSDGHRRRRRPVRGRRAHMPSGCPQPTAGARR